MDEAKDTIPEQTKGADINVEETVMLSSLAEAKEFFGVAKSRLLNIGKWKEWAGALSAGFVLTNKEGQEIDTFPTEGNYFKIDIPAPGISIGEGYDWVRIEEIKEAETNGGEYVAIKVRPAPSPLNEKEDVAHFLTDEATSNFIVKRDGLQVSAGVFGRNEKPNVEANTLMDKVRNAVVGIGAVHAFAKIQWKALVSGLLDR